MAHLASVQRKPITRIPETILQRTRMHASFPHLAVEKKFSQNGLAAKASVFQDHALLRFGELPAQNGKAALFLQGVLRKLASSGVKTVECFAFGKEVDELRKIGFSVVSKDAGINVKRTIKDSAFYDFVQANAIVKMEMRLKH